MRKTILAATVATMAVASGAAVAADLPRGPVPYYSNPAPAGAFNWTGAYAGANVGYEWGKITNGSTEPSGIVGGLQGGYNWQSGQFVFGGETDIQVSGADDTFAPYKFSNPWFGTLRGRAGVAFNNVLIYGTLGLAYGGLKGEIAGLDESKTHVGWAGGLGMEVGFAPNWSAKVEYLYMDLGNRGYSITGVDNGLEANILRFGVNYHF
jgi:outer membrane immunogenic protein